MTRATDREGGKRWEKREEEDPPHKSIFLEKPSRMVDEPASYSSSLAK